MQLNSNLLTDNTYNYEFNNKIDLCLVIYSLSKFVTNKF